MEGDEAAGAAGRRREERAHDPGWAGAAEILATVQPGSKEWQENSQSVCAIRGDQDGPFHRRGDYMAQQCWPNLRGACSSKCVAHLEADQFDYRKWD